MGFPPSGRIAEDPTLSAVRTARLPSPQLAHGARAAAALRMLPRGFRTPFLAEPATGALTERAAARKKGGGRSNSRRARMCAIHIQSNMRMRAWGRGAVLTSFGLCAGERGARVRRARGRMLAMDVIWM